MMKVIQKFGGRRLLLLFVPISLFVMVYIFLSLVPKVSPKLWPHYQERYFTWTIAGFTYYNNQLVQHSIAMILAHSFGRKIVSPNFRMSGTQEIVAYNKLFDVSAPTFSHYFHNTSGKEEVDREQFKEVTMHELTTDSSPLSHVKVHGEDLWDYSYPRFMFYWHFYREPLILASRAMPLGGTLKTYVEWYTKLQDGKLGRSLGVHLRSWNPAVSLVKGFECAAIYRHDPRKEFYSCIPTVEEIMHNIDFHYYRYIESHKGKIPDIFLATDLNPNGPEVRRLRMHYPTLYTVSDLEAPPSDPNDVLSLDKMYVPALIDAALLVHTEVFLGNYFSTLTQITVIRREFLNCHLYHPVWALWMWKHWIVTSFGALSLVALLVIFFILLRRAIRKLIFMCRLRLQQRSLVE